MVGLIQFSSFYLKNDKNMIKHIDKVYIYDIIESSQRYYEVIIHQEGVLFKGTS